MKEYSLYVPCNYADGSPVEPEKFLQLKQQLLDHFGEFTEYPQHSQGEWSIGPATFRGDVALFRMFSAKPAPARRFLKALKKQLQEAWGQQDILVVEADVSLIDGVPDRERI